MGGGRVAMNIELADILDAQKVLMGHVVRSPLIYSVPLSRDTGAEVWLKPEHWQLTGSFKFRGAYYKMSRLSSDERARGVITASAGNHAQGVALAGRMLGISVMVVVPTTTPKTKIEGIRQYGAEVIIEGAYYDASEAIAYGRAEQTGSVFVHAFEDDQVAAGQGTVGLEMLVDRPDLQTLVVPAGGGGLVCGIGAAAMAVKPRGIEVVGVQSEASPAWYEAWQAGKVVDVQYQETWADGLLGAIGHENFLFAQRVVNRFVLVSETEIKAAMRWALAEHHWILEGSAAVGLAWALFRGSELKGRRVGIVLTGGNLDITRIRELVLNAGD